VGIVFAADPFILQESCDLSTTNWTTVTNTPTVKSQLNQVALPISAGNKCYPSPAKWKLKTGELWDLFRD